MNHSPQDPSPSPDASDPRTSPLSTSVVVLNHNRADSLLRCLESVFLLDPPPCEVIVVDNASSDDSQARTQALYGDRVTWIARRENSVTAARNEGFRQARGDTVLSLDNDIILPNPSTLSVGSVWFDKFPGVGLLAFGITSPDFPNHHQEEHWWHPVPQAENENRAFWTPYFSEAAILFRKEALTRTGGYDEDFFRGGEQLDWALAMIDKGFGILYCPDMIAVEEEVRGELKTQNHPIHFLNLRNRLWTAWKRLPFPAAFLWGAAWTGAAFLRACRYGHLGYWWKGFCQGAFAPGKIRAKRKPISRRALAEWRALRTGRLVQ